LNKTSMHPFTLFVYSLWGTTFLGRGIRWGTLQNPPKPTLWWGNSGESQIR
jgi:hypothetical protein